MASVCEFGHKKLQEFYLEEGILHLNHGSYGATPRVVNDLSYGFRHQMEKDPTYFYNFLLHDLLRNSAKEIANFLGGDADDWVFVENTTAGINAIIKSLSSLDGGEVICTSLVYPGILNTLKYYSKKLNFSIKEIQIPIPFDNNELLLEELQKSITPQTRLALFEHVTSFGGIILPIKELSEICRSREIIVLLDGAHAPGQIPFNVPELKVDYFVGNLHKWAFAPKGAAVLWCRQKLQSNIHPLVISNFYGQGYHKEFAYSGTRDNSSWLAASRGIQYLEAYGASNIMNHNHELVKAASNYIALKWKSHVAASNNHIASMASIQLPWVKNVDNNSSKELIRWFKEKKGIVVSIAPYGKDLWIRISAQIYNELSDYEFLAVAAMDLKYY